jgi:murein DD-endopeptidase MepM/ murein hydrolase activator NlpD
MREKHVKLIYFSLGGSEVKQISLGWKRIVGLATLGFAFLLFLVSLILGIFTDLFHNWQVAHLSKANAQMQDLLVKMSQKVENIEGQVKGIERQDDDLRVFVDLPPINSDVRKLGVGGHSQATYGNVSSVSENARDQAAQIQNTLENLTQRIDMAIESRQVIMQKYRDDLKKLKQTPSVRPLLGGRITDVFGFRLDPFIDKFKHHEGIDFSAPRGTDIYATADGVVVVANSHYKPNASYGKEIIIDHGYGVRTRYAHLDRILVKPGDVVKRYTIIGKVGDTGRSTGPHLHYEVITGDKNVNPDEFILE